MKMHMWVAGNMCVIIHICMKQQLMKKKTVDFKEIKKCYMEEIGRKKVKKKVI